MSSPAIPKRRLQKGFTSHIRSRPNTRQPQAPLENSSLEDAISISFENDDDPIKDSEEYLKKLIQSIFASSDLPDSKNFTVQEYLPAFTASTKVDLELYALVGLFLRQFVLSWYGRLSTDEDNEFLNEIVGVTAHMTRNLQERCTKLNWGEVLFEDLFIILEKHLDTIRMTRKQMGSRFNYEEDDNEDIEFIKNYICLNRHFAIDFENPQVEKQYSMMLVKSIVSLLIPFEELDSKISRHFLVAIFNDMIVKNVISNLSDNFMLWNLIGSVCDSFLSKNQQEKQKQVKQEESGNLRKKTIYDTFLELSRTIGHLIAYTTSVFTSDKQNSENPVLCYAVLPFMCSMFQFNSNFPLLHLQISLLGGLLSRSAKFNHLVSNMLNNLIYNVILTDSTVSSFIRILRNIMFPTDTEFNTAPRYIPTTVEQLKEVKDVNRSKLIKVLKMNPMLSKLLFKNENNLQVQVDCFFMSFNYKLINKLLLWNLLDLLFTRLFPEILEFTPTDIVNHNI